MGKFVVGHCGMMVLITVLLGCDNSAPPTAESTPVPTTGSSPAPADKVATDTPAPNSKPATPTTTPTLPVAEAAPTPTTTSAPAVAAKPATIDEAMKVLDLRTFPQVPGANKEASLSLASASYEVPGPPLPAFKFLQEKLAAAKWQELAGGYTSAEGASGTFSRAGYVLSLSVFADSSDTKQPQSRVYMINHGNVDSQQLPTPSGVKLLYKGPVSTAYISEDSVDDAKATVITLLAEQGWERYGEAGDTLNFKQQAIEVSATIGAAPAQDGKTVITYSSRLLSADIPLPPESLRAHFSDNPSQLSFDSAADYNAITKFYRERLKLAGWEATTENLVKIDWKSFLIFRNPQKDLMEVQLTTFEGQSRVLVRYQTAAQVEAVETALAAEIARKKAERENPPAKPQLTIKLPADATGLDTAESRLEFKVGNGKAKAAVEAIQKSLTDAGWKADGVTYEEMFGNVVLKKGDAMLTLTYVETGVLPPEITISSFSMDLKAEK